MKSTSMRFVCVAAGAAVLAALALPICAQDSFGEAARQQPQQQPQQPRPQAPAAGPGPQQRPPPAQSGPVTGASNLDQLMQAERKDYGVAPTQRLHGGEMHAPTPASIPGGQVITTKGLAALVQGKQTPYLLLDVLGGTETLPGALPAAWASQPGSFDDAVQQRYGQALQQATRGNKQMPVVLYCLSTHCWMSYNAALRAINLGYTNVLWYRGGIEAWKTAGMPTTGSR